jgi:hypothetical protein
MTRPHPMNDPPVSPFELRLRHRWKFFYANHHGRGYLAFLAAGAVAGCLAFLLPWFTVVGWSYVPYQETLSPLVAWSVLAGAVWFALMIGVATYAFASRRPLFCAVGFASMIPTVTLLTVLAVAFFLTPSLIPISWKFHGHRLSLGVSGGVGSILAAFSAMLLLLWFLVLLLHSRRLHRKHRSDSISDKVALSAGDSHSIEGSLLSSQRVTGEGASTGDGTTAIQPSLSLHEALRNLGLIDVKAIVSDEGASRIDLRENLYGGEDGIPPVDPRD